MLTDAEEVSEQVGVYVRVDSFEGADGTLSVQELVTTTSFMDIPQIAAVSV